MTFLELVIKKIEDSLDKIEPCHGLLYVYTMLIYVS